MLLGTAASKSACYNTSEGFYRYKHGEFGKHLNIARGSLGEALDQIDEGAENKYFTFDQHSEMRRICLRAMKCNVALRRSWESEAPERLKRESNGELLQSSEPKTGVEKKPGAPST